LKRQALNEKAEVIFCLILPSHNDCGGFGGVFHEGLIFGGVISAKSLRALAGNYRSKS
jgi:hypothetical protein